MSRDAKKVFVIHHNDNCKNKSEKLSETDLKKITTNLEKAGVVWIYLPPGLNYKISQEANRYHDDEDEDDGC